MRDAAPAGTQISEAVEVLGLCVHVAEALNVDVGSIRPCIARLWLEGASRGEGREPYLHVLALELSEKIKLPLSVVRQHLREWNLRLSPPLPVSDIEKVMRRLGRPGNHAYGCSHARLQALCIGDDDCPHARNVRRWSQNLSPNGFVIAGWLAALRPKEAVLWLACYRLARLKGRAPNDKVPFTFRELERISNIDRHYHREILEGLERLRLLSSFTVASKRGGHSTFTLPPSLPAVPLDNTD